ncbi:hypothetical protein [Pseudonocardia alni]|uniref:hypothetical protein n=1 Tax=Pseudonocardia alni TaxID=33907 RepID=UPI003333371B
MTLRATRTEVGTVDAGGDSVVVAVVRRRWQGTKNDFTAKGGTPTVAPGAVEVRRDPERRGDDVGGLTPARARDLAAVIVRAADQAEVEPTNDGEPTPTPPRRRGR